MDDGEHVWKEYIPATSKKELKNQWKGNGEFVRIKEVPEILPSAIRVIEALEKDGFGKAECNLIYRLLYQYVDGTKED